MQQTPIDKDFDAPPTTFGGGQTKQTDIKSARVEVIATAEDAVNLTEPSTPTHSVYPYNKAHQTPSGHLFEIDDTPGAERLMTMHKSGTFEEIHPDGTKVTKIYGDDFQIVLADHTLTVGGKLNVVIQGNCNQLVKGNVNQKVDGDYNLIVNGNYTSRVKGNRIDYTKGTQDIQSKGAMRVFTDATLNAQSLQDMTLRCETNRRDYTTGTLSQQSKGAMSIYTNASLSIQSKSDTTMKAGGNKLDYTVGTLNLQSGDVMDIFSDSDINIESDTSIILWSSTLKMEIADGNLNMQADNVNIFAHNKLNLQSDNDITMLSSGDTYNWADGTRWSNAAGGGELFDKLSTLGFVTNPHIGDKQPASTAVNSPVKLIDIDPGSGLTIPDSLIQPTVDVMLAVRVDNNAAFKLPSTNITFPKDRTKNS